MSEYTPTTEDVREAILAASILIAQEAGVEPPDQGEVEAEFKRWLQSERARIWDEGAECADENWFWHDGGRHSNPYRTKEDA